MRKWLGATVSGMLLMSFAPQADTAEIIRALKSNSAESIETYFDNLIDLSLPGKGSLNDIGKKQAGMVLQGFYEQNGIRSFELSSQREAGSIMYIAGKLTGQNRNYNITVLLRVLYNSHHIVSVRIN